MWTHPAQCPLCGPQRVQCSQNRSFLSSTETGQHWCPPSHMCRFQSNNPQIPNLFHLLQEKEKVNFFYWINIRDISVINYGKSSTLTKAWCDTDVINSNKSTVGRLCFDQQLSMRSKSVNMIKYLYSLLLLSLPQRLCRLPGKVCCLSLQTERTWSSCVHYCYCWTSDPPPTSLNACTPLTSPRHWQTAKCHIFTWCARWDMWKK